MLDDATAFAPTTLDLSAAERLVQAALASASGSGPLAQADLFLEQSVRDVRGMSLARDAERPHVPMQRDDRGAALRVVSPEASRGVHVAGSAGERFERLEEAWRREASGAEGCVLSAARHQVDAPTMPDPPILRRLVEAARVALQREPRLVAVDVEITRTLRATDVISSCWAASACRREWTLASLVARASDGRAGGRALRSRGGRSLEGLDAAALVAELVDAALARLACRPAPGLRPVVIVAGGAAGVLLHEAVGHALEADVVARGSSFLASRIGEQVATEHLTVVDDPSLPDLAGSYASDDEGAPAREALLIERGMLRGVMTDALRSGFDRARATGHGRRQGFRDGVLPRMTNTLVLAGPWDPSELLSTTRDGLLVTRLERASADPLRGRFQVRATEGYIIEDGRVTAPLEETLLVGTSDDLLRGLDVAGDVAWDDGAGTCGREAQWVSVAIGNPTLRAAAGVFRVA